MRCRIFGVFDFIRVPAPAASTMTAIALRPDCLLIDDPSLETLTAAGEILRIEVPTSRPHAV
ncbi:hypothetical protein GCM10023197_40410 [Gordonia humi]